MATSNKQTVEPGLVTPCYQIEVWHREPALAIPDLRGAVTVCSRDYELIAITNSDSLERVYRCTSSEDGWVHPDVILAPPYGWNYCWNAGQWFEEPFRYTEPGDVLVKDDGHAFLVISANEFRLVAGFANLPL